MPWKECSVMDERCCQNTPLKGAKLGADQGVKAERRLTVVGENLKS